jgi:lipopolysaccharide export LptBFGC system permease protein LptF
LSRGKMSFALGMWWVHIPILLIALYLLWRSQQLPKPKMKPAAGVA